VIFRPKEFLEYLEYIGLVTKETSVNFQNKMAQLTKIKKFEQKKLI